MSPRTFPACTLVELTPEARLRPFWKSERWRNGQGRVIGDSNGALKVEMKAPGLLTSKIYYIKPDQLREVVG